MSESGSDGLNSTCPKCDHIVEESDLALCCEGNCGRWFHCACIEMSEVHCNMFTALEDQAI